MAHIGDELSANREEALVGYEFEDDEFFYARVIGGRVDSRAQGRVC